MYELAQGIRDLHDKVAHLDDLLREDQATRDIHEKLAAAAAEQADEARRMAALAHDLIRKIFIVVTVALMTWTPFIAYGAVWSHELVRNTCYNGVTLVKPDEPHWYCSIFPGTGRHDAH